VVSIVKYQLHTGSAGWFAGVGAIENDVLHRLATQFRRLRLAQHPAHRVHDVGFAAAIGTNHAHQLTRQHEIGWFSKRLESG
jgi:hypothetical protein